MRRFRPRVRVLLLLAAASVSAGCSGVERLSFPNPPSTAATPAPAQPTLPSDLSSVSEAPVAGMTTTTLPLVRGGHATLDGTVLGPGGPAAGATVQAVRVVGAASAAITTTTRADGTWSIRGIVGGDYRVRAWLPPSLDLTTPEILFVGDSGVVSLSLVLSSFTGPAVAVALDPATPEVGHPVSLLVQVTTPWVNASGIVVNPPVAKAPVRLLDGPEWKLSSANPASTDSFGDALFTATCELAGLDVLYATVGSSHPLALQMPSCSAPTPPPGATTTTTCPPGDTTTTSAIPAAGPATAKRGTC